MNDIYIFFYLIKNSEFLYKNFKSLSIEKINDVSYVKLHYNSKVIKYFYKFCNEFEKEEYFYNINVGKTVEVVLKITDTISVIVNSIYNTGCSFIPENLLFHINKKILAIANGSQDYFYYLNF